MFHKDKLLYPHHTQYRLLNIKQSKDQLFQIHLLERKLHIRDLSNMRQNHNIRHQLFTHSNLLNMSNSFQSNKEFFHQPTKSLNKQRKFLLFWILRDNLSLQLVLDKIQMMSIKDLLQTTVSKNHLAQKFQLEIKFLKVNKTWNRPQESSQTHMDRIQTPQKEYIQLNQRTKDF
jgi:hypothetical protein